MRTHCIVQGVCAGVCAGVCVLVCVLVCVCSVVSDSLQPPMLAFVCLSAVAQKYPYQNPKLSPQERAKDLCGRLTLEEKVGLMMHYSRPVERLDVPVFQWWSEALHGVGRNGHATVFPITMGMAASFDTVLVERVFTAVSDEARVKHLKLDLFNDRASAYSYFAIFVTNVAHYESCV